MKKVLIISPKALENGRGGEISSLELALGLNDFYSVAFLDTNIITEKNATSKKKIMNKLKAINNCYRIRFATLKFFGKLFTFPYPQDIVKMYKIIKKADLVYFSIFDIKFTSIILLSGLVFRNNKYIIGYRKPLHINKSFSLYNLKYRISILFISLFKKRVFHHTISNHAKKFLKKFYLPNRVTHITHGIDLNTYFEDSIPLKSSDTLNFLYIGYLDDIHKGTGILIEAIDYLLEHNKNLNCFFDFCGMGPLESNLRNLEIKYPKYIKFHGYVDTEEVHRYYKKSDVYLFTSRKEPFGRVLIEALSANELIICSNTIGSNEILKGKDFAFFIKNLDSIELSNKILEVYNLWDENPDRIKELQKKAKEYVFKNYSLKNEIKQFRELFEKIVK